MTTVIENETKTRSVSYSFLERLRIKENQSVKEFFEAVLAYEVSNPSQSLGESLTNYSDSRKNSVTKVSTRI
jgi:hypothetical protein